MNLSALLLQDPIIALELIAVISCFIFIARLALLEGPELESRIMQDQKSNQPTTIRRHSTDSARMSLFRVGNLISLPKRSLSQQYYYC